MLCMRHNHSVLQHFNATLLGSVPGLATPYNTADKENREDGQGNRAICGQTARNSQVSGNVDMGLREQGERSMPPATVTWDITAISTPAHIQTAGKSVVPNESPESMTNNPSPPGEKSAIMQATLWGESQAWGMQQNVEFWGR